MREKLMSSKASKPPGEAKTVQQFPLFSEVSIMIFHGHL
jgi:hypothetical protein